MEKNEFFERAGRAKKALKIALALQTHYADRAIGALAQLTGEERMHICHWTSIVSYPSDETWELAILIHRAMREEGLTFTQAVRA